MERLASPLKCGFCMDLGHAVTDVLHWWLLRRHSAKSVRRWPEEEACSWPRYDRQQPAPSGGGNNMGITGAYPGWCNIPRHSAVRFVIISAIWECCRSTKIYKSSMITFLHWVQCASPPCLVIVLMPRSEEMLRCYSAYLDCITVFVFITIVLWSLTSLSILTSEPSTSQNIISSQVLMTG